MRNRTVLLALILGFVPGTAPVYAQEPEDEAQPPKLRMEKAAHGKTREGNPDRYPLRTLEEFIPSEKISADKPVSFPADI